MKIALFTDTYEPFISGVTTSIKMLKEALEDMNHEVYIVTANLENRKFKYDKNNKIIYIPGIKTNIYDARLTKFYSIKAMKIIKSWNLDIIHSQTEFGIGLFSRIVAKKLKIPVVHTYHTMYEDYVYYITHGHFDNLAKKVVVKMTKYYCEKKCDQVIVPTEKIKDLFINKYNITKNINVIPTGIDLTRFKLNDKIIKDVTKLKKKFKLNDNNFIIGSVGRIASEKSFDKLLKNAHALISENSNIFVMLVGDGPELGNLKKLAKELNIEKNVIFTGKVPYDEVPSYFNLFDVMTSFSTTETQGLTILEGLAAKKPTLCVNDESFKDTIENNYNGYLFNDDFEFRKYVITLMHDKKLYDNLSKNAFNSIYKYSKEVFASEVLKVYHKAIEKKK